MKTKQGKLIHLMNVYLCFMFYAFLGWIYEVLLELCVYRRGFINRGFLFGPWLPVYGFAVLAIIACFYRYKTADRENSSFPKRLKKFIIIFIGIMILTTGIELIASYIMEYALGGWQWDYTRFKPNFQGRIALNPSIRFGIGGIAVIYVFQPMLEKIKNRYQNKKWYLIGGTVLFVLFAADCLLRLKYGSNLAM